MDKDYENTNRDSRGFLKDCTLGALKRINKCNRADCPTCGWNPREIERRKENGKLHKHWNGLWGF